MLKNKSATFGANNINGTIEITQLENNTTTHFDAFVLLQLLEDNDNNVTSRYCHKGNIDLSYNRKNFHLYSYPQAINTYLTRGFDRQLKQYILDNFKDIEKATGISSLNETINETIIDVTKKTNTNIPLIPTEETIVDSNLERCLSFLTSDELLHLYKKRIIQEQISNEELPWRV